MKALSFFWLLLLCAWSFNSFTQMNLLSPIQEIIDMDTLEVSSATETKTYKPSRKITSKINHLRLEIKPSFKDRKINGLAQITLQPQYHPVNQVILDARGMNIKQVLLLNKGQYIPLQYTYDNLILDISLGTVFTKNQPYTLLIEYVASPYELEEKGVMPSSGRGVFFINPQNINPHKPTQIWTQNQAESASCWFPTIDAPNIKFRQEVLITVPKKFITLSNGVFISSKINADDTKTDYWRQNLPHPSYLTMFAVGEFEIAKDKWENLDVNYYTERGYGKWVKEVFKNTPYMMSYFSEVLKVDFPWEKYHQLVVRDFTAGAMENTTASVFYEPLLLDSITIHEKNHDAIIAHELFHHWFGDLVTCESWANLSLNESLATYGEYLWHQSKYGQEYADYYFFLDKQKYLKETFYKVEPIVNFYYDDTEDLFDAHRYEKGGWVLHMLRNYLGDNIFFDVLAEYLNTYKFGEVEIHQLRMAFEKLSGEDMNWFFNQWFLSKGHPKLKIANSYNEKSKNLEIHIEQTQDLKETPLFVFPLEISIYIKDEVKKEVLWVDAHKKNYLISLEQSPNVVVFNENNGVLCEMEENKSVKELIAQLQYSNGVTAKLDAIELLSLSEDKIAQAALKVELKSEYWFIRKFVLDQMNFIYNDSDVEGKITDIALHDLNINVRISAINYLDESEYNLHNLAKEIIKKDSSYELLAKAIEIIQRYDYAEALRLAESHKVRPNNPINRAKASLYAKTGAAHHFDDFREIIMSTWYRALNPIVGSFAVYLSKTDFPTYKKGMDFLDSFYLDERESSYRNKVKKVISELEGLFEENNDYLDKSSKLKALSNLKMRLGI